ncbi:MULTISPECIES: hypothetical protein [Dyella]|jgi:prepilin signal peptidase PulO-like enzyme (type II secretory pathway)|uniref:hypothetical protein n=1 Tax=Dyella TaxID=231454 RepID=UPI000C82B0F8|nr:MULTISPECIES: hypothetical protein [Dyella]MDR3445417.1 hypothetical protein [Dyella sp.]PMQ05807.1 hypothetical protein DyAD56_07885 [Dyella sp. AD56]ULU23160.1 hypothetical protein DYST_00051 [Dyella terrae]
MSIFFGYFIWGLILAAPLGWLWWRFRLGYWLSRSRTLFRRHKIQLPAPLEPLVIRGKRQGAAGRKA